MWLQEDERSVEAKHIVLQHSLCSILIYGFKTTTCVSSCMRFSV